MNLQPRTEVYAQPRRPKRVRHYVVAYQCTRCDRWGYLEDFTGEQETFCSCGQSICVEIDQ